MKKEIKEKDKTKIMKAMNDLDKVLQEKKDYTKIVEYINNYLSEKSTMLHSACKHLTSKWTEHNVENIFKAQSSAIYYNGAFRIKILIQSEIGNVNCIFYSRQDSISCVMADYKPELKEAIQDFILSVIGDLMERGLESMRREVIADERSRMYLDKGDKVPGAQILMKPIFIDEVA